MDGICPCYGTLLGTGRKNWDIAQLCLHLLSLVWVCQFYTKNIRSQLVPSLGRRAIVQPAPLWCCNQHICLIGHLSIATRVGSSHELDICFADRLETYDAVDASVAASRASRSAH